MYLVLLFLNWCYKKGLHPQKNGDMDENKWTKKKKEKKA